MNVENQEESAYNGKAFPSVSERYFKRYFATDLKNQKCEDQCVLAHSNKVCMITIAPSHPIISQNKNVLKIDFQVTKGCNRLDNKVQGKRKKGGMWMNDASRLCTVLCDDDTQYTLYSVMDGRLIEMNNDLVDNPNLIKEETERGGYIALIFPRIQDFDKKVSKLLTLEQYNDVVQKRKMDMNETEAGIVEKLTVSEQESDNESSQPKRPKIDSCENG